MKKEETRRIVDVQNLLVGATVDQLDAPLQRTKEGKYLITPAILEAYGLTVDSSGTIQRRTNPSGRRKTTLGPLKHATDNKADGTTSTKAVPSGKVWKILLIQASFLMDANVATRTCNLRIPDIGLGGIAGTAPNSLFIQPAISLTATQYGYLIITNNNHYSQNCTNGAIAQQTVYWKDLPLSQGADIQAAISTNPRATDKTGLDILYREYDLES